jgi:hypothetical protein
MNKRLLCRLYVRLFGLCSMASSQVLPRKLSRLRMGSTIEPNWANMLLDSIGPKFIGRLLKSRHSGRSRSSHRSAIGKNTLVHQQQNVKMRTTGQRLAGVVRPELEVYDNQRTLEDGRDGRRC